jgi:hypothetical protein
VDIANNSIRIRIFTTNCRNKITSTQAMQASRKKGYAGKKKNVPDCKDGKTFPPKKGL